MDTLTGHTIGIFDSGIGGLTVFRAVAQRCPNAKIIYLGDTARLPYGSKSPETITKYLLQNVNFLLQQRVDSIVVACNSASTILDDIKIEIPIQGVITAGSKRAIASSKNKIIGIMGTRATVNAKGYSRTIKNLDSSYQIFEQACPLLVPLVEEGMINDPVTFDLVRRYTTPLIAKNVDTIILGCTHYPILKDIIQMVVGPEIKLVDSADSIADMYINQNFAGNGDHKFYLSDTSNNFIEMAKFILGKEKISLEHVNL